LVYYFVLERSVVDNIDRKILDELQANCRISNRELAARIGLSPSPCLRRLRLLERERAIVEYTAIIAPEALGLGLAAFAQVTLDKGDTSLDDRFLADLANVEAVFGWYACAGDYDYLVKVVVPDQDSYLKAMVAMRRLKGVAGIKSGIVMNPQAGLFAFYRSSHPRFHPKKLNSMDSRLDGFDRKVIAELQANARITILELSKRIALSPPATLQRLRKLELTRTIQGYTAVVDPAASGLHLVALIAVTMEKGANGRSFEKAMLSRPEVAACFSVAGDVDYEIRAVFSDIEGYAKFLKDFLRRLKGVAHVHSSLCISPPAHLFSRYRRIASPLDA
jgi:DNA-binding Lrp family transcriptional regulator